MSESPESVTLELANKLLQADGLAMFSKGHGQAATRTQIGEAFAEAASLVNKVRGER